MSIRLDSMEAVAKLTEGDKIVNRKTNVRYCVKDVFKEFLIVCNNEEQRAMKIVLIPELMKDHWEMEKDN
jgi:hypothetical protein